MFSYVKINLFTKHTEIYKIASNLKVGDKIKSICFTTNAGKIKWSASNSILTEANYPQVVFTIRIHGILTLINENGVKTTVNYATIKNSSIQYLENWVFTNTISSIEI